MKVYLSRSNAADPAVFSIVKAVITNLGHEVVTFNGGQYSKEPLLACDALVVIPSDEMLPGFRRKEHSTSLSDNQPDIGKGQFQQCVDFAKKHAESYNDVAFDGDLMDIHMQENKLMLLVQEIDNSDPENPAVYVHNIVDVRCMDISDWKTRYGFLDTDNCYYNIGSMLGRALQTELPTCPQEMYDCKTAEQIVYATSSSPSIMLGAASILGIL